MSEGEDKKEGVWGRLISEVVAFIPKDLRELIGFQIGMWFFILTPMILISGTITLLNAFNEPPKQEVPCWQIQTAEGRAFKINSCTGETIELPATPSAPIEKMP